MSSPRLEESEEIILKYEESNQLEFILNGTKITVDTTTLTPKTTLNEYLRKNLNLTGTKYMCLAGGCGACVVTATFVNPKTNTKETKAVNSCLVTVLMIQGWEITTIEGIGSRAQGYHEIQQKVVQFNATQCGFCTPGMVMNMYALKQEGTMKMAQIENSFSGNLCRCTGYRPILSAFKSMASDSDQAVIGLVPDIEELGLCSNKNSCHQNCLIPCQKNCESPVILRTNQNENNLGASGNWYKVSKIKDIFTIFKKNSGKSYQLVAGNTAQCFHKDLINRDYFIDISGVQELKGYSHNTTNLVLGGNLTLKETISVCKKVAKSDDGFKHLEKVANHIDLVANVPVRNIGTLAGNLTIKYTHHEFPSDIFVLFETIGAVIVTDDGSSQTKLSPSEYLNFNMDKKLIRSIEIPPVDESYRFESYKIMKRAQNAHAIINAGFLFKFRKNIVQNCTIVFGGVNPSFVHASKTESLIEGKALFDNSNMQKFFSKLLSEIQPDDVLPQPLPQFRQKLCVSLFYKFILSIAPNGLVSQKNSSGGPKLLRPPVSTGVQDYKTNESRYPVGEPIHKLEAADQAAGEAMYVTDKPDVHNQCFAALVLGKAPPGSTLLSVSATDALNLEGVEGFFQASDIPGVNSFMIPIPVLQLEDEEIFLPIGGKVKFYYQPVGLIVAKSQRIAETAVELVKVTFDAATTSPVLTTKEALNHPERVQHYNTWMPSNQNTTMPVKFEGTFESLSQYHNYMELQVASVYPEENGELTINVGTQWMDFVQSSVMRSMNIPAHKIKINVRRVGGSYGGKISRANWVACAATLGAIKLNKPVKLYMSLESCMNLMGKRHHIRSAYEVGVDNNGVLGYLNNNIYANTGFARNSAIEEFIFEVYEGPYVTDSFYTELDIIRTDIQAATYIRSPGFMEGSAIIENIMEHVACRLDKDPIDVKLANLKDNTVLKKIINECLEWSDYRTRRAAIEKFNKENNWRKKGISLVPMAYTLSGYSPYYAQVSVFQADGTVAITHGGIEIGQGINTKVAQVAAYLLGIDINLINIWPSNNFIAPNNFTVGGSVTTESICIALTTACKNLLDRINQAAADKGLPSETPWLAKIQNAYGSGVALTENASYSHDQTNPTFYVVYGAGVSEIELDVLTGQIIVQRADLVEDTGDSLNPYIDIGQVEGAYIMGLGHWTCEEIIFDDEGALKTNNTWNYKVPGAKDIPVDFRVKLPDGIPNPATLYNNKAACEPPFALAFSVPLAIKHALKSVRTQFNATVDPWATMEGPCSVEWIYLNSNHDIKQYKL